MEISNCIGHSFYLLWHFYNVFPFIARTNVEPWIWTISVSSTTDRAISESPAPCNFILPRYVIFHRPFSFHLQQAVSLFIHGHLSDLCIHYTFRIPVPEITVRYIQIASCSRSNYFHFVIGRIWHVSLSSNCAKKVL